MSRSAVSSIHSLKIIPLSRVLRFARIKFRVRMYIIGYADDALAIPGSINVSQTSENGIAKKKITFERSDVSDFTANILDGYKASRLIATYIDEFGRHRVAGSPNWPLSLDYTITGGTFSVTLKGEDTVPDAFLSE